MILTFFPWQFLPRRILQLLLWWTLRVSSDWRSVWSQWHCTSLSMTNGMQMMGTIKLRGRAVTVYQHTVYQAISITIPYYNMVSIHPVIPYSRFISQEKTSANLTFLWRIMKDLFTNTIWHQFQTHFRMPPVTRLRGTSPWPSGSCAAVKQAVTSFLPHRRALPLGTRLFPAIKDLRQHSPSTLPGNSPKNILHSLSYPIIPLLFPP